MKWTRQRCQVAPTRISATARLRPRWLSEVTSRTPRRPAAHQLPQEGSPKLQVLGRTDVHTEDLPFAGPFDPDRDQDRHRDHPTVLPYLLEGGVQHQVGVFVVQGSGSEGMDLGIKLLADSTDLVLGDALESKGLGQGVHRTRTDSFFLGLVDHREQGSLVAPARLQQAREIGPTTQLGNVQLDGAYPGVPLPFPVAIAIGEPVL